MSADRFIVAAVLSARGWPTKLHSFVADHVPDTDVIVVRDQRAALEAGPQVLLVDDTTPWLTASFLEMAYAARIRVVGVYDRADGPDGRERLAGLGLTHLIEAAMPPDDVVFLLERLRPVPGTSITSDREVVSPVAANGTDAEDGCIVAVGGPSGSGARELAVALSTSWASDGWSTVLVDLNESTPGVARRLGLAAYPHVLTAVDRVRTEGACGLPAAVADRVPGRPFDVIVGLPNPREWDRLLPADAERLLLACTEVWDRVVVTTSPMIDDLRRWVDRFGVSRRALGVADCVVGCCEPTPRGVLRHLDWVSEASPICPWMITALNKLPKSPRIVGQVRSLVSDAVGDMVGDVVELPFDKAVERAEWDATLVTKGRYATAVRHAVSVIDRVLTDSAPVVSEVAR